MGDYNNSMEQLIKETLIQNQEIIRALIVNNGNNSSNNNSHPAIKLKDPPSYDGVRDAVVIDDWITAIENQQEFHGWSDEVTYKFAVNYLTGRAAQWIKRLKDQGEAPVGWGIFKDIFIKKYRPDNADLLARDLLATCVQKTSIEAFVEEFQDVIHMLPDLTEDEKCDRFTRGLSSDEVRAILRNISKDKRCMDLFISTALSYEAARAPNYHALAKHLAVQSHIHSSTLGGTHTSSLNTASSSSVYEINDPMEINVIKQFRNWRQQQGSNSGGTNNSNNNGGGNKITCYYCGKIGHVKRSCNKLRKDVEKEVMERTRGGSNNSKRGRLNVIESSSQNDGADNANGNNSSSTTASNDDNKVMNNASRSYSCDVVNDELSSVVVNEESLICNAMDVSGCAEDLQHFKAIDFNTIGINTELPLYHGTVEQVDSVIFEQV